MQSWIAGRKIAVVTALAVALSGCSGPSLTVSPAQLPGATVGQEYLVPITATSSDGTPWTAHLSVSVDAGSLPPGLALRQMSNLTPGALAGIPTAAGTFTFRLRTTGEFCTMGGCPYGLRDYTLVVAP